MYILTRSEMKAHQFALQTLADIYMSTGTGTEKSSDTAALLADRLGLENAAEAVALAIIEWGERDAQISVTNRQWAEEVLPLGNEYFCKDGLIIYPYEVPAAQLDMIANEMRTLMAKKCP